MQILGLSQGRVVEASRRFVYDEATDTMRDLVNEQDCRPGDTDSTKGNFICEDGTPLTPGWVTTIGLANYTAILTNEAIRGPFLGVFTWNLVFAFLSVATTFAVGLGLALTMQHERLRGRVLYRSVFILPYAVPAFLSILIWQRLFNAQFGQVNQLLGTFGIDPIPWFSDPYLAAQLIAVYLCWAFPTRPDLHRALQAIPSDLIEKAGSDGAGPVGRPGPSPSRCSSCRWRRC